MTAIRSRERCAIWKRIQEDEITICGSLNAIWKKIQEDERQEVGGSPQRGACPHSVQGARRRPCRNR